MIWKENDITYDIINIGCGKVKKIYMISKVALVIITFVIFSIMIINEDSSWNIVPIIFSLIAFGFSFPSTIFAKKIITIGDKIRNVFFKIVFYIVLPIALLVICLAFYMGINYIYDTFITTPNELGAALGQALLLLFIVAVVSIAIIMPYIQAIIIIILKRIIK